MKSAKFADDLGNTITVEEVLRVVSKGDENRNEIFTVFKKFGKDDKLLDSFELGYLDAKALASAINYVTGIK
jgi:hypothetical protein